MLLSRERERENQIGLSSRNKTKITFRPAGQQLVAGFKLEKDIKCGLRIVASCVWCAQAYMADHYRQTESTEFESVSHFGLTQISTYSL